MKVPSVRSPLKFFAWTFALSVPIWLAGAIIGDAPAWAPMRLPISALAAVCPIVAAMLLIARGREAGGIRGLWRRVFDHHELRPKGWYAPIVLLMPTILFVSYWVMRLIGRPLPQATVPLLAAPLLFVLFFVAAVGEEGGWTAYATDPLLRRHNVLTAGLLLGLVWAAWHVVPLVQAHRSVRWIAWHSLSIIALRVIMVWLYARTGSVFGAVVFHAMSNVSYTLFPNNGSHYDPAVTAAVIGTVAAGVGTAEWWRKARHRGQDTDGFDGAHASVRR
ncbi:CPBP family intramembrane glutamic endopeptidase [Lentzea aerocolonigenes]|uniref:CPBP family intramembrane glutamic endopeptidase n=1 Tax=Lentzea aerocolonigenes TaxID=68170 RepID=UPI000690494D|nr:type II CAAX endopeptidase family protein [Lentzea aerocolonigenes]MCP2242342.1 hypothetical protein [Lentzea aerocolonigenes]